MEEKEIKNKGKCASCGASIRQNEKVCSYCGSPNVEYVEPKVEEIKPPKDDNDDDFNFGGMLGGVLGSMMLGGIMRGFGGGPRRRR